VTGLEHTLGPLWPYFLVIVIGFLPSEFWRVCSAVFSGWIDDRSEVFVWVKLVATALVAAVVAKLLLQPPEALAAVPAWVRFGSLLVGTVVFRMLGGNAFAGVAAGVLTLLVAGSMM
jgi:hypothetical protein